MIRANYIKAKIDKTQQNSECRLCDDRDKTINHIITQLSGEGDSLGIVQEIEIWSYEQVVYAQFRIRLEEWDAQTPLEFWDTNQSRILGEKTRACDRQQEEVNLTNSGLCRHGRP